MDKTLIEKWLDKQIEYWYAGRLIRTLCFGGGSEFTTNLNINSNMEIHLCGDGSVTVKDIADILGVECKEESFNGDSYKQSFTYKGFLVFGLVDKEE